MCTAGGSSREAPRPIATLSGTSPRGRARGRLCRTIDSLPSIRFPQPLMMCWRRTAGWTTAGYAGLPLPETLPEEIWRSYWPRASPPKRCPAKAILVGVAALSPVTDLTLSGATYETRADADLYLRSSKSPKWCIPIWEAPTRTIHWRRRSRDVFPGCLPSAFTSATTKCCSTTRDDTSSVPLPTVSMPGLMCGRACHMDLSQSSEHQGVRTGAGCDRHCFSLDRFKGRK